MAAGPRRRFFRTSRGRPLDYGTWTAILQSELERLECELDADVDTVLDPYGATNLAEFFAAATEAFFETPHELLRERPALYEQLKQYYRQHPVTYMDGDIDRAG